MEIWVLLVAYWGHKICLHYFCNLYLFLYMYSYIQSIVFLNLIFICPLWAHDWKIKFLYIYLWSSSTQIVLLLYIYLYLHSISHYDHMKFMSSILLCRCTQYNFMLLNHPFTLRVHPLQVHMLPLQTDYPSKLNNCFFSWKVLII